MLHPVYKKKKILRHIIIEDVEIVKLGKKEDNITCPEQILFSFKEDENLIELPGAQVCHGYGNNSIIMSYDSFRRLVVKMAVTLSECDEEFNQLLADEDKESSDKLFPES
jgi:hypothetical protein